LTYEEENLSYLIGVVSYGNKHCGCPTTSTVFARITKVIPWILAKIQRGECGFIHDQLSKRKSPMNYLDRKGTRELRNTFIKEKKKEKQRRHRKDRGERILLKKFRLCC